MSAIEAAEADLLEITRVACLDDDADYRLLVGLALDAAEGFELVAASTVDDLALAELARTEPDVVLLDVTRGSRGIAMLPRLAAPHAQIIALVSFDADDLRGSLTHAGAIGQIAKRTRPSALAGEIRTMIAMLELVARAVDGIQAVATELDAELTSGRQARTFVDAALREWGCDDLADTVTLLISELVANAVMHARSSTEIRVLLHPGCVRLEVADHDPTIPKRRVTDPESPSGRGLALVEQLSRSWGIEPTSTGKCIWFEVDRPDRDARGEP